MLKTKLTHLKFRIIESWVPLPQGCQVADAEFSYCSKRRDRVVGKFGADLQECVCVFCNPKKSRGDIMHHRLVDVTMEIYIIHKDLIRVKRRQRI